MSKRRHRDSRFTGSINRACRRGWMTAALRARWPAPRHQHPERVSEWSEDSATLRGISARSVNLDANASRGASGLACFVGILLASLTGCDEAPSFDATSWNDWPGCRGERRRSRGRLRSHRSAPVVPLRPSAVGSGGGSRSAARPLHADLRGCRKTRHSGRRARRRRLCCGVGSRLAAVAVIGAIFRARERLLGSAPDTSVRPRALHRVAWLWAGVCWPRRKDGKSSWASDASMGGERCLPVRCRPASLRRSMNRAMSRSRGRCASIP